MLGYIDGYNFKEMEAMKYYAPPASWDTEKKITNAKNKIFSNEFFGAQKYDGYFCKIVKDEDGNIGVYSRSRGVNGEFPEKSEWVPQLNDFFESLPNGTCLLGELYLPSSPGSSNITKILGCLKEKAIERQAKGEKLHLYVFDILAYKNKSFLNDKFISRIECLSSLKISSYDFIEYVSFATYYRGHSLWEQLQIILNNGGEGIVITHQDALYAPGKRSAKATLKIKKELHNNIDCFFTGKISAPAKEYTGISIETWTYWEDEVTGQKFEGELYDHYYTGSPIIPITKSYYLGMAGSLEIGVYKDGKIISLGWLSGLTDEIKLNYKDYAMRCIEVNAMQFTDDTCTALRHGKFIQFRDDLNPEDCTWEKIAK